MNSLMNSALHASVSNPLDFTSVVDECGAVRCDDVKPDVGGYCSNRLYPLNTLCSVCCIQVLVRYFCLYTGRFLHHKSQVASSKLIKSNNGTTLTDRINLVLK